MAVEQENSVVSIEYEVKDAKTGEVVDSNKGAQPLDFVTGKGQIIPGLENKLVGMSKDESADIYVKAADAYGEYNEEAKQTLPKEQFEGIDLQEGMTLYGQGENGQTVQVIVEKIEEDQVTIDFNHPLAGKDLMFTVKVLDERPATEEEAQTGVVGGHGGGGCGTGCGCH